MKINVRKLLVSAAGVGILVLAYVLGGRMGGGQPTGPPGGAGSKGPAKAAVRVQTIANSTITKNIPLTGRVVPKERIDLYAEYAGRTYYGVRPFKPGVKFNKGELLLSIDDSELQQNIKAARSNFMQLLAQTLPDLKLDYPTIHNSWRSYLAGLQPTKKLPPLPAVENEQQRLFLTGRSIYTTYFTIQELETRLRKFKLYAPFSGTVTEALIDPGTRVTPNTRLGEYSRTGVYELEVMVQYADLDLLTRQAQVAFEQVSGQSGPAAAMATTLKEVQGKLVRINEKVDPQSQLVSVFFELRHPALKSGLYLEGSLPGQTMANCVEVPNTALLNDSTVLVVQNEKALAQSVQLLDRSLNSAIISGLPNGAQLIIDKNTMAFEGAPVAITQ